MRGKNMKTKKGRGTASAPDAAEVDFFAAMCKALGHPARIMIINYLQKIDRCLCGDIVQLLPLAQSTVSQHLKCLKKAGFIRGVVEGPRTCYCLDEEKLKKFSRMAAALGRPTPPPAGDRQTG